MGPGGLTAVFGMGTGVALRVWPPGTLLGYTVPVPREPHSEREQNL